MFQAVSHLAGNQPFNDWFSPDSTQRHALGIPVDAVDPYWGWGRFVYVKALSTMEKGSLVGWDEVFTAADIPNTANLGRPAAILMSPMVTGQFGWMQVQGFAPVSAQASVAADTAVGVAAAGQLGANAAGKQCLGYRNRLASAATKILANVQTTNGSGVIVTNGYDGWFLGIAITGTGVPASSVAAALSPDGRSVTLGSAVGVFDKLCTATGSISATGTYTGFILGVFSNMIMQGAIT